MRKQYFSLGQTAPVRTRQQELEYRRGRGQLACAQCQRSKLKCNRKVPCSTCLRRGCQSICPNGYVSDVQDTQIEIGVNDRMKNKMIEMMQRIYQLEDALRTLEVSIPQKAKTIIGDTLLGTKSYDNGFETRRHVKEDSEPVTKLMDAFNTMSVNEVEEERYVRHRPIEILFQLGKEAPTLSTSDGRPSGSETSDFAALSLTKNEKLKLILMRAPPYEQSLDLIDAYHSRFGWCSRPIDRDQLKGEILPKVYDALWKQSQSNEAQADDDDEGDEGNGLRPCDLAVFFAVLACGVVADLLPPALDEKASLYEQYARMALGLSSVLENTSIETVQALGLLSMYQVFTSITMNAEPSWETSTFAMILATHMNLHRDPAQKELELKIMERRRMVFWELYAVDKQMSLELGRPSIINLRDVDCRFPEDKEASVAADGTFKPSYWRWKYSYTREVMGPVSELMCQTRPVKYSEILELDRKIREFYTKPVPDEGPSQPNDTGKVFWQSSFKIYRESALMSLHRNFFAHALLQNPHESLSGPFSFSVLATYASALSLLKVMREQFEKHGHLLFHRWIIWAQSLIAGTVVGIIAIKKPSQNAAEMSLRELQKTIELFECASMSPVAKGGLPVLRRLLVKATASVPDEAASRRDDVPLEPQAHSHHERRTSDLFAVDSLQSIFFDPAQVSRRGTVDAIRSPGQPDPIPAPLQSTGDHVSWPAMQYPDAMLMNYGERLENGDHYGYPTGALPAQASVELLHGQFADEPRSTSEGMGPAGAPNTGSDSEAPNDTFDFLMQDLLSNENRAGANLGGYDVPPRSSTWWPFMYSMQ